MTEDHQTLLRRAVALGRPLLVALDVDGTIAPIVAVPEAARVPGPTVAVLEKLARVPGVKVALVTGRDERSLEHVVRVPQAWVALEHGRRVVKPGGHAGPLKLEPEALRRLEDFHVWALEEAMPRGGRLEEKEGAWAVHVRELAERAPQEAKRLLEEAERVAKDLGLQVRHGRAVVEAEVHQGDKGRALRTLIVAARAKSVIYVGDDVTDYPALRAASDLGGFGVFVRSPERRRPPPGARGTLSGPEDVAEWLAELADALRRPRASSRGRGSTSRS
jgi:trehalose 6-phosphate phosphatase